jgi:hypothetical protein
MGSLAGDIHPLGGTMAKGRIRGIVTTAIVMKGIEVARRELSKPENQRKIKEGVGKLRAKVSPPKS